MTGPVFISGVAVLLTGSVALEVGVLSGLWYLPTAGYHLIHLSLMAALLAGMLLLHRHRQRRRAGAADAPVALLFAAGLAFTGIGDFVNSGLSPVGAVTAKLSWALLFFALGYGCYVVGLVKGLALLAAPRPGWVWLLVPAILAVNVVGWITRVEHRVEGSPLLYYGSFVFNATLYVVLPWLAVRYLLLRRFRVDGVLVLGGTLLAAYSDLVLFDSWLALPAGVAVPTALYATNWIVYFGGQCLITLFPAALAAEDRVYSVAVP